MERERESEREEGEVREESWVSASQEMAGTRRKREEFVRRS